MPHFPKVRLLDVFADGQIDFERFRSDGEIGSITELNQAIRQQDEQ